MDIVTVDVQGRVRVTVLQLQGELDGRTYRELIGTAQAAYGAGARKMVLDLGGVGFLSSSGLVAIHSIAKMLQAEELPDLEAGWSTLHALEHEVATNKGLNPNLKLVNPQPAVDKVLLTSGFRQAFEVHPDVGAAVASF